MTERNSMEWEDNYEIVELDEMIKKSIHPEMQDLDPYEEFVIVKFEGNKELQDRIDKLKDTL